jgi:hypothetical protein
MSITKYYMSISYSIETYRTKAANSNNTTMLFRHVYVGRVLRWYLRYYRGHCCDCGHRCWCNLREFCGSFGGWVVRNLRRPAALPTPSKPVPPLSIPGWELLWGPPPLSWVWVWGSRVPRAMLSIDTNAMCNRRPCLARHLTIPVDVPRLPTAQSARADGICEGGPATDVLTVYTRPDICP